MVGRCNFEKRIDQVKLASNREPNFETINRKPDSKTGNCHFCVNFTSTLALQHAKLIQRHTQDHHDQRIRQEKAPERAH